MAGRVTLIVEPSLALPGRWSVDYCDASRPNAVYQASIRTYLSKQEAVAEAQKIAQVFEARSQTVELTQTDENLSRKSIPAPEEDAKQLEEYISRFLEDSYKPLGDISMSWILNIFNWPKIFTTIFTKTPLTMSILFGIAIIYREHADRLLTFIIPDEFGITGSNVLAAAPIMVMLCAFAWHYGTARNARRNDRARIWILQLAVYYNFTRDKLVALWRRHWRGLDYVSLADRMLNFPQPNLIMTSRLGLLPRLDQRAQEQGYADHQALIQCLQHDDYARKIQALAGVAREPGYRPKRLAVDPLSLLLRPDTVRGIVEALVQGDNPKTADDSRILRITESTHKCIPIFLVIFDLPFLVFPLKWATDIAWETSSYLYYADILAIALTLWLMYIKRLSAVLQRKFIPRGLAFYEFGGAIVPS